MPLSHNRNIFAMSETPITAVFARDGAMAAEVGATTKSWDEVSDEMWQKWKDQSGVPSGISASLVRHILTEHGIKFERKQSKECFTCPCGKSVVGGTSFAQTHILNADLCKYYREGSTLITHVKMRAKEGQEKKKLCAVAVDTSTIGHKRSRVDLSGDFSPEANQKAGARSLQGMFANQMKADAQNNKLHLQDAILEYCVAVKIPIRTCDAPAFKHLVALLVDYKGEFKPPCATTMRTTVFGRVYNNATIMRSGLFDSLKDTGCSMLSDGATNMRRSSLNTMLLTPASQKIPLRSYDTTGDGHLKKGGAYISADLVMAMAELGHWSSVVTICVMDRGGGCARAQELLKKTYPRMLQQRCALHAAGLLVGDITKLGFFAEFTANMMSLIRVYNRFGAVRSCFLKYFDEGNLGKMETPAETRMGGFCIFVRAMCDRQGAISAALKSDEMSIAIASACKQDRKEDGSTQAHLTRFATNLKSDVLFNDRLFKYGAFFTDLMEPVMVFLRQMDLGTPNLSLGVPFFRGIEQVLTSETIDSLWGKYFADPIDLVWVPQENAKTELKRSLMAVVVKRKPDCVSVNARVAHYMSAATLLNKELPAEGNMADDVRSIVCAMAGKNAQMPEAYNFYGNIAKERHALKEALKGTHRWIAEDVNARERKFQDPVFWNLVCDSGLPLPNLLPIARRLVNCMASQGAVERLNKSVKLVRTANQNRKADTTVTKCMVISSMSDYNRCAGSSLTVGKKICSFKKLYNEIARYRHNLHGTKQVERLAQGYIVELCRRIDTQEGHLAERQAAIEDLHIQRRQCNEDLYELQPPSATQQASRHGVQHEERYVRKKNLLKELKGNLEREITDAASQMQGKLGAIEQLKDARDEHEDPQCPFADEHIEQIFDFDNEELVEVAKELEDSEELEREEEAGD